MFGLSGQVFGALQLSIRSSELSIWNSRAKCWGFDLLQIGPLTSKTNARHSAAMRAVAMLSLLQAMLPGCHSCCWLAPAKLPLAAAVLQILLSLPLSGQLLAGRAAAATSSPAAAAISCEVANSSCCCHAAAAAGNATLRTQQPVAHDCVHRQSPGCHLLTYWHCSGSSTLQSAGSGAKHWLKHEILIPGNNASVLLASALTKTHCNGT